MMTGTKREVYLCAMLCGTRRALVATALGCFGAIATAACGGDDTAVNSGNTGGSSSSGAAGSSTSGAGGQGGSTMTAGGGGTGGSAGAAGAGGLVGAGGTAGGVVEAGPGDGATADAAPMSCSPGHALSLSNNGAGTGNGANGDAAAARVDIDFGASVDLPAGNTNRTIEYWAFVLSNSWAGNANTMFFYGSTGRPAKGFGLDFGGTKGSIDPYTNGGYDNDNQPTGLDATKDQWVHFAMTWDGTSVRTFVNGVQKTMKTGDPGVTALATDRSPITVGGYPQDGNYFNGTIDEFRVWNVAHSAAEITATMNKPLVGDEPGLVAYLKFDETSGTAAADSVTTAAHMAHNGVLKSDNGKLPTFIVSTAPLCL